MMFEMMSALLVLTLVLLVVLTVLMIAEGMFLLVAMILGTGHGDFADDDHDAAGDAGDAGMMPVMKKNLALVMMTKK